MRFVIDSATRYEDDAEPVRVDVESGTYVLARGILRVRPAAAVSTITEARAGTDPVLRAWEFQDAIQTGFESFRFAFLSAEVIGPVDVPDAEPLQCTRDDSGPLVITYACYPDPPQIRVTTEMEVIWERFSRSRLGLREPLQSCAYFALTVAESLAGTRAAASDKFGMSGEVLRKLGELTSSRGEPSTARKAVRGGSAPLTKREEKWIDAAVRLLLLQMGVVATGVRPDRITMADLPNLS